MPGGCWFFTANLLDRRSTLLIKEIEALREATRRTRERYPLRIDAFVVLPDHVHAIWTLPSDDADVALATDQDPVLEIDTKDRTIEQSSSGAQRARYLGASEDYRRHVEYCYINPVKHGLVGRVRDWPFSSFHRDVAPGLFPTDWAGDSDTVGEFGEV